MAVVLPGEDAYDKLDGSAAIRPGSDAFAEHKRAVIENQHHLLAHLERGYHVDEAFENWDGTNDYIEIAAAAGTVEVLTNFFFTSPAKAATVNPRAVVRADITGGGVGKIFFDVLDDAGALLGTITFNVNALAYFDETWSPAHVAAKLDGLTWYRWRVRMDANTAATVRLYRVSMWEAQISAAGDLP